MHPMDSKKFGNAMKKLRKRNVPTDATEPVEAPPELLARVHDPSYLHELRTSSLAVARACELGTLAMMPNRSLDQHVLAPMRRMVAGTVLASAIALKRNSYAINLGGGMHHAEFARGKGWCLFRDISAAIVELTEALDQPLRILYIDVDVHQGDGVELWKADGLPGACDGTTLSICDIFNPSLFPGDRYAERFADIAVRLEPGCDGPSYMQKLRSALERVFEKRAQYDLCIYNAGTDTLDGDPLGGLKVPHEVLVEREETVVRKVLEENEVPVVQVLSGGYTRESASVVANAVSNLYQKGFVKQ
jgi:histone deacetylase 11